MAGDEGSAPPTRSRWHTTVSPAVRAAFFLAGRWPRLQQGNRLAGPNVVGVRRGRLGGAGGRTTPALQVFYPAATHTSSISLKYFRSEALDGLADFTGSPRVIFDPLSLRDHPAAAGASILEPPFGGWPVVLFSHGLAGSMEMYTQLCMQIASFGFVVVAIEHEDGSGAYAERAPPSTTSNEHAVFDLPAKGTEAIYYTRPPPGDWERPAIVEYRAPQQSHRLDELRATLERIQATDASKAPQAHHSMAMYSRPAAKAVQHDGTSLLSVFQHCDTSRVSLIGHSFGGATVALAASPSAALPTGPPVAVVMLDVWAGCLSDEQIREQRPVPMLAIYSEAWKSQVLDSPCARDLLSSAPALRAALILKKTVHQSFSDVANWVPGAVSRCASASDSVPYPSPLRLSLTERPALTPLLAPPQPLKKPLLSRPHPNAPHPPQCMPCPNPAALPLPRQAHQRAGQNRDHPHYSPAQTPCPSATK
jgi:platelet-activating factor acetylhydrolase